MVSAKLLLVKYYTFKVLFVSLMAGKSQTSAENGRWEKHGLGRGPQFDLNQGKQRVLLSAGFGRSRAPSAVPEPPTWAAMPVLLVQKPRLTCGFRVDCAQKMLWGKFLF